MQHARKLDTESSYLRAIIDAIPNPVFVLDGEVRVVDCNKAAAQLSGADRRRVFTQLCGNILHCIHDRDAKDGCGTSEACDECVIRGSVKQVMDGNNVIRQKTELLLISKDDLPRSAHMLVTAAPFSHDGRNLALLTLEDITELIEVQGIIPICANCKKVRDDDQYWECVEGYLSKRTTMRFSHSVCPECVTKLYPDWE